jgi:hypothetical protein
LASARHDESRNQFHELVFQWPKGSNCYGNGVKILHVFGFTFYAEHVLQ